MRSEVKTSIVKWLSISIGVLALLASAQFIYWELFDARPAIVIHVQPFDVMPDEAQPGDEVVMIADFTKKVDTSAELTRYWQRKSDGRLHQIETVDMNIAAGRQTLQIPLTIPLDIENGEWKRVNRAEYYVNPVRRAETYEWESEYIVIRRIPPEEKGVLR